MGEIVRRTYSLCPVCGRKLPAVLEREGGCVSIRRTCPDHGEFSAPVWRDRVDFDAWTSGEEPLTPELWDSCGGDCPRCSCHQQDTCCVLLEVTKRCDLRCAFCFADGSSEGEDPPAALLLGEIEDIAGKGDRPLIQFSGGEPTLRDDLPELIGHAVRSGCSFTQVNTNGLRLAREPEYARMLARAGLDIVFLQFDGVEDGVYRALRGGDMLEAKLRAIENCGAAGLGVTLVPTVVRGVNDTALGDVVRTAVSLSPTVRGVHFQPVTYLGRTPGAASSEDRFTLDELISDLCLQAGIDMNCVIPSRCDHALCGFHATFMVDGNRLVPMTNRENIRKDCRTGAARNRQFVGSHWKGAAVAGDAPREAVKDSLGDMDFDTFVKRMRTHSLTLSAMAFQDAMNINLERLMRCSLHVYQDGRLLPFCAKYMRSPV